MAWKIRLAQYCVELFGFHGSEMGYEYAVPHTNYFEGLLSRSPFLRAPAPGARLIPLFELVYRDCIALYTHQGDRAGPSSAAYVLYHLGLGRMPLYRFGNHLYWKTDVPAGTRATVASVRVKSMRLVAPRTVEAVYEWKVMNGTRQDARAFVHFGSGRSNFPFQNDHDLARPTSSWKNTRRSGRTTAWPFLWCVIPVYVKPLVAKRDLLKRVDGGGPCVRRGEPAVQQRAPRRH